VKAVQVVVQARLGERVTAPSKPDTAGGTSWFNLAVKDNSEVMSETKRALGGQVPSPGLPLVCEISLKTSEGDSLVLELWRLAVVSGGDQAVKVQPVYNRMSLLLKSLVTVARVTPAYRLSRRQGADSYVICYRVFLGDPHQGPDLGEGALTAKVGQVTTPTATIVCCVDYRTNMTINHGKAASQPILVKSDHFDSAAGGPGGHRTKRDHRLSDCVSDSDTGAGITSDESAEATRIFATSPLDGREGPSPHHRPRADSGGSVSSQERFRVGAFASGGDLPSLEEELQQEPLLQLLPRPRPASTVSVQSGEVSNTSAGTDTDTQFLMSSDSGSKVQMEPREPKAAKVPVAKRPSLTELMGARDEAAGGARPGAARRPSGNSLFGTMEVNNDYVMVDLKTPFAAQHST
jgi:autophagy-related protein 13